MSNITIISTNNTILFDYGDYCHKTKRKKETIQKDNINNIMLMSDKPLVVVDIDNSDRFEFVVSGGSCELVVDSVNEESLNDIDDLYTKLINLIS